MKLFTKEIDKKLFQQYSKGADLENQKVVARIFNPYGRGEWYLLNSDPEDPDYIWAIVSLFEVETGSVSRQELETIKVPPFNLNLERDLYFQPVNAKQLYEKLIAQQSKRYDEGGQTKEFNLAGFLDYVYPTVSATATIHGLELKPDYSISNDGTYFYEYLPEVISENGIVNKVNLFYADPYTRLIVGKISFELDENEFELEFENWMVDTEGKYEMGGYLQQKMEDLPLAKTILGRAERSGYITPEEAANPKFIWAAIETAEGHLEDEEIGSSDMTFIMKEFFDYFGDIGITTAWENSRLIVKRMDEGGIISDSEVEMLQERGVTIEQMQTLLKSKFPDSFSFALYRPKEGTFGIKKPEPDLDADGYYGIQDASLKLYFDKFHSANYKIYQGEENTYYYFTLNDEKGNEYVGSFGFKDRGDVPKEYVTKFLVFLQQAYGQPFKVYHGVYEDGGYMAGGGVAQENNEMLRSNIKEIGHHQEEISKLVNKDTPVEAWVIAKSERAANDLSDITHYIEGKKMKSGGYIEDGEKKYEYDIEFDKEDRNILVEVTIKNQDELLYNFTGKLIKYSSGRATEYEFQPDWFADQQTEDFYSKNWEKFEDIILDKYYSKKKKSDGGYMAKGGNVKSKNYHKYGDENSRLVNFDIYDLDDFETMQYEHISKSVSKAEALQVLINNVEGDYSQLSPKLAKIAEEQHPSQEWEEEYRKGYMAGGGETIIKIKDIPQLDIYESDVFNSVSLSVPLPEPNQNFSNPVGKVEQDYDENKSRYIKNSFTATKYDYSKKKNVNGRIKYFEEEKIGTFKSRDEAKNALLEEYFDLSNLPKEVIMAAGGKVNENDMYVVYFEQTIFGQNTPVITYASKSKKLAEEKLKEQPNYNIYSKNKYKVGLASEMPVYSNFQYLNKPTKELKKAKGIIHQEKRVMNFFKGKDASFKNKFSYVKPEGYRWNNDYELVKEMSMGGSTKRRKRATFEEGAKAIAKRLEGTKVPPKYRKDYGAVYDREEALTAGRKIKGKIRAKENK